MEKRISMFGKFCLEKQWTNYRCSVAPRQFPLEWHGKPIIIVSFSFLTVKGNQPRPSNFAMYLFWSWVFWVLLSKPCMRCHTHLKFNCNVWVAILVISNFSCNVVSWPKGGNKWKKLSSDYWFSEHWRSLYYFLLIFFLIVYSNNDGENWCLSLFHKYIVY